MQMSAVLELPPRLGCRMRVSLESRKATCGLPSLSCLITRPSWVKLLLMAAACGGARKGQRMTTGMHEGAEGVTPFRARARRSTWKRAACLNQC